MYALRKDDLQPASRRRVPSQAVALNGIYARWENGRLKIGSARGGSRRGVFWTAPGDTVVEAYIQARLHLMGLGRPGGQHDHRMSEWFITDLTTDELIPLLTRLQAEARRLDERWKRRRATA